MLRNEVSALKMLQVNFAELRSVTLVREYDLAARQDALEYMPLSHRLTFLLRRGRAASSATLQSPLDVTSVI